ncbi:MAG: hypothetical protein U5Q03_12235 [Bacteroidota bacterium]|nr:hypothetical protein [Bacteroidota bacterium]
MNTTSLYIKNMVCNRCIKVVNEEISKLGFAVEDIELGRVKVTGNLNEREISQIDSILRSNGFEIIEDNNSRIINQLKTRVIELIHYDPEMTGHINISQYLAVRSDTVILSEQAFLTSSRHHA